MNEELQLDNEIEETIANGPKTTLRGISVALFVVFCGMLIGCFCGCLIYFVLCRVVDIEGLVDDAPAPKRVVYTEEQVRKNQEFQELIDKEMESFCKYQLGNTNYDDNIH